MSGDKQQSGSKAIITCLFGLFRESIMNFFLHVQYSIQQNLPRAHCPIPSWAKPQMFQEPRNAPDQLYESHTGESLVIAAQESKVQRKRDKGKIQIKKDMNNKICVSLRLSICVCLSVCLSVYCYCSSRVKSTAKERLGKNTK